MIVLIKYPRVFVIDFEQMTTEYNLLEKNSFARAGSPLREDDDCMDAEGRATQEQLPTTPYF
jgi:hypothetical protein